MDGWADLRLALNAIDKFGGPSASNLSVRFASNFLSVLCLPIPITCAELMSRWWSSGFCSKSGINGPKKVRYLSVGWKFFEGVYIVNMYI